MEYCFLDYLDKELIRPIGRLPSAYQEVEYIEATGTQYITTDYYPSSNTRCQFKYMYTHYNGSMFLGAPRTDWRFFRFAGSSSAYPMGTYFDVPSGRIIWQHAPSTTDIYETEIGNYYIKDLTTGTNKVTGTAKTYGSQSYSIQLFDGTDYGRIYYLKIYEGNTLVRELVPCYRKSDNVIGMYDAVNSVFYTNSGTGTFTKGSNV